MSPLLTHIATAIPAGREDNLAKLEKFATDEEFIREKIGALRVARKAASEETSDLCVQACEALFAQTGLAKEAVECLVVVTQNPDGGGIPHVSAIVHGRLGLPVACAVFDLSLACSGFVYGLSVVGAFMAAHGMKTGVLVTCDPYSKIIDPDDKNTVLLFGDAAAATLLQTPAPGVQGWRLSHAKFATDGSKGAALNNAQPGRRLRMDGRAVFNFTATVVPEQIKAVLASASLTTAEIDLFCFHQGSKFILDTLAKRLGLPAEKVPCNLADLGNTVSSSIPILFADYLHHPELRRVLCSGFGVGLSWASGILERA